MGKPIEKKFTGKLLDDERVVTVTVDYSIADGKITGKVTLRGGATSSFDIPTTNKTLPPDYLLRSAGRQHVEALLKTGQHEPIGSVLVTLTPAS